MDARRDVLIGLRILVVEDEMLIEPARPEFVSRRG
jgi:hypothetical protein